MTNAIQSPTSKKARFLILKQKDVASSPTYQIDFPKSYTELFEIARTKFKGKTTVRTLYGEENLVITSIESLKSGSTIYVTSKPPNQGSPTIATTTKSSRGLSVQVTSKSDILSKTNPTKQTPKRIERAKTLTTNTPSPKIKSKTLAVTSASKSEKKSTLHSKESPNASIKDKNMNASRRKTTTTKTTSTPDPSPKPTQSPSPNKASSKSTPKSTSDANKERIESPSDKIPESPLIPKKETPTNQKLKAHFDLSNTTPPNTNSDQKTPPSSQIKTSPNRKPRASSLSKPKTNKVESPTNNIPVPVLANEEPISKKITLSPPIAPSNLPKPSPVFQQINFTDSNDDQDDQNSSKPSPIPSVQIQIQDDQDPNSQSKMNKRRNTRSSTYFQLDQINKTNSQDILQTTSKTYHRLKNNIIQDDSSVSRANVIQQPKSSSSVPHVHSKSSASMDRNEIPKNLSLGLINNEKDIKPEKPNNEDDDAKLFSQIHLRDKRGRRSNTLFTKKSIESAIDVLTYFSPRNAMLKPKQANIQSDGDDDEENVYKTSQVKNDKTQASDKTGTEKEAEKDTLDAFRDSEGSDLFSSSNDGDFIIPTQSKAPILSLTNPNNNSSKNSSPNNLNNATNTSTESKSNALNIVPVRYEAQPMSSPANLDQFMESDDDMFMFGSDSDQDKDGSTLKINMNKANKEYSEYDEYDDYDEYEIELNNFNENSPSKFIVNSKQEATKSKTLNPNKTADFVPKVSPSTSGQIDHFEEKNSLNYAKNAISHHRSQSRSSYSFQNQTKLDITAIIDGSLQSPIAILVQSPVDEPLSFEILPRNRSNSVALDTSSTASSKNKTSPRIPKRPDVIQFHTNANNPSSSNANNGGSNSNTYSMGPNIGSNNLNKPRARFNSTAPGGFKNNTKQTRFLSSDSASTKSMTNSLSSKQANAGVMNSGSSSSVSGNRSRTNSLSRRNRSGSRGSTSSHYERIILSLLDSLSSGKAVQSEEDLVFSLIDRAVGRYPQESLGLPADITPSKILPIMENQQGTAWIATGCLIASLQNIPEVESSIFCYNDMVECSRGILSKHVFYSESRLVNKVGSIMGSNCRFNIAVIGPRNSGKSTLLRVLTEQLIADLFLGENWRSTFVFIFNMENLCVETRQNSLKSENNDKEIEYEFDVRRLFLTILNITIQHLLWHIPQLLGITKQLTRYFESAVSTNRTHMRHFPRTLTSYNPEIAHELQNIAAILSAIWNNSDGFEDFVNAVLLFPKMIANAFNFKKTLFIIDHYDVCHRFVEPSSSTPFKKSKDKSNGIWLTDAMNRAFIENTDFIIATKDDNRFFEGPYKQRIHIEMFSTTDIVKRPLSKINGSISDVIFSVTVEGRDENDPIVISFDACGGTPRYMYMWNKMNMAADDMLDFKQEGNSESLVNATSMFLECLFVDEKGSKIHYNILSVKRMKKKQKK